MDVKLIGLRKIPLIKENDDIAKIILDSMDLEGIEILDGDIFVIAETAVSKSEGTIIDLNSITPSKRAFELSKKTGKKPEIVEAIIQESNEIIKVGPDFIISETKHGFVCANAGIDESNVDGGLATPMPVDPDKSASDIRIKLENAAGSEIAIIISDTQGRAFREGAVGTAIGISGMEALWDRRGENDLYGRELETTSIAVADELASAASIIMGQADEGIPVVIIRGVEYFKKLKTNSSTAKSLLRPKKYDVFR
ncbi:MAG: coenzyme F420-0:L-glutamate ligase [Methanobacterium paludis]|nr:coenzyme F420-0:L-glutamate ligase [Methanobacterium paludis]